MKEVLTRGSRGFSLIELLIVLVIMGVIAAIAIPNLLRAKRESNEHGTMATMVVMAQECVKEFSKCNAEKVTHHYVITVTSGTKGSFIVRGVPQTAEGSFRDGDRSFAIFSVSGTDAVYGRAGGAAPVSHDGDGVTRVN